jgi:hypothetical protein
MSVIDVAKTVFINIGNAQLVDLHIAIESQRCAGHRVGESATGWGRLWEDCHGVAQGPWRTVRSRAVEKSRGRWKLHMDRRLGSICIRWGRDRRKNIVLANWRWHGMGHYWGVCRGASARRCHGVGPLTAIASV